MTWQDDAVRLRDEGKTFPEIARLLRDQHHRVFSSEQIRSVYRRRADGLRVQKERVTFEDIKQATDEGMDEYIDKVIALQEAQAALDTRQVDATITIDDDKPIGIAATADWHIGGFGTDLSLLRDDLNLIGATEGLYGIFDGDAGEDYLPHGHPGGQLQQVIQPKMQYAIAAHLIRQTCGKWLGFVKGCHDMWREKDGDHDFISEIAHDVNALNLWHGGTLNVNLGSQSYKGHIRHRFYGESKLNPLLPCRRMIEAYGIADFSMVAHKHFAAMEQCQMQGRDVLLMRPGSYKILDDYGQQIGGYAGLPRVPVIVLYPGTHRVDGYLDLRQGVEALRHARR